MGPLGTRSMQNRPVNKNSSPKLDDSPLHDEGGKNTATKDECFKATVPCEDNETQPLDHCSITQIQYLPNEDEYFDTQVMNFYNETQPVNLYEDTEIQYLPGETQEMDDFDLDEYMDTQLLDVSDIENNCDDDEHGAERTQILSEPNQSLSRNARNAGDAEENTIHTCHQEDRGSKTKELPPDDSVPSSGSLRKGFTAIRTASLRVAALKAQRKDLNDASHGSCSTDFSSRSSNLQCLNNQGGVLNVETVDLGHDTETDDEKGLRNEFRNKVARSLAKEFSMEDDPDNKVCNDSQSGEMTSMLQLPNEAAGLSYVDSQEPGELSQANVLEFVDRFLKINVLETDHDIRNPTGEIVSPDTIAKGPQSLAQHTNIRNSLAGASVYDWDDNHEDEGGGEFFSKKKEVLFGTSCGSGKVCIKPENSRKHRPNRSQSTGKLRKEKEHQNRHEKAMDPVQSDSKLVKSRRISQHKEARKKGDNYPDLPGGVPSYEKEVLAAAASCEQTNMLDIGLDTQMAAEAMEALSAGNMLVTNDDGTGDHPNVNRKAAMKNTSKRSSVNNQTFISTSGTTRLKSSNRVNVKSDGESKCPVASRTRSQYAVKELNIDMVKPKVKRTRLCRKSISVVNVNKSSDRLANIDGKKALGAKVGQPDSSASVPIERRKLQDEASLSAPVARRTRQLEVVNHVNGTSDKPGDTRGEWQSREVAQSGRDVTYCSTRTRSDVDSDNLNAREETSDVTTMAVSAKNDKASGSQKNLQHSFNQVNETTKKQRLLRASGRLEVISQSITRKTRSKRSARCAELPEEGKVLRSGVVVSSGHDCQLSAGKHKACLFPAEGVVPPIQVEGSPIQLRNSSSPANITPVNWKTPTSAVSPLCIGDGYPSPSSKKRSLSREFYRLTASELKCTSPSKDLRQKRDFNSVRVLFSQHLDDDVTRKQKKILSRLGVLEASSILEATHFVADVFLRTRNMLEAIANGKPVVTHLWLESCGQSNCFIDEKNYILRDAKKEKELGFSMPNTLARASHYPLLEGRRVLITPNVKPSKEIVSGLVKAVHGQAIERLCRFMPNNSRLPDHLLVLSCEEDFQECVPLLEKGMGVYSSELLLNGIITQKLEYERYRIFADHVKRTRSTLWVKKNGDKFLAVTATN